MTEQSIKHTIHKATARIIALDANLETRTYDWINLSARVHEVIGWKKTDATDALIMNLTACLLKKRGFNEK